MTGLNAKQADVRVATFITVIGPDALDLNVHNYLPNANEVEKKNSDKVLELWETLCYGKANVIYERYACHNLVQDD